MYSHSPFISDIARYISLNKYSLNNKTFSDVKNIPIMTQLLSVLPPSCSNLLPKKYRDLVLSEKSPIIDLFPIRIKLDMIGKDQYWQCIPMIPTLDIDRVLEATKMLPQTKTEIVRSTELLDFII